MEESGIPKKIRELLIKEFANTLTERVKEVLDNSEIKIEVPDDSPLAQEIVEKIFESAVDTVDLIDQNATIEMETSLDNIETDIMDILENNNVLTPEEAERVWDSLSDNPLPEYCDTCHHKINWDVSGSECANCGTLLPAMPKVEGMVEEVMIEVDEKEVWTSGGPPPPPKPEEVPTQEELDERWGWDL
jgi:hypothetical protein